MIRSVRKLFGQFEVIDAFHVHRSIKVMVPFRTMSKRSAVLLGLTSVLVLLVSSTDSQGQRRDRDRFSSTRPTISALPQSVNAPPDNLLTADKIALGKLLFWDPILSGNRDVACVTCHHPRDGYAEDRDLSIGVNGVGLGRNRRFQSPNSIPFVKRNSQTMVNVGFNGIGQTGQYSPADAPMFWDVRVKSLETQALEPIKSFEEMRGDAYPEEKALETVVARLNAIPEYRALFAKAFGGENPVNATNLGKAIASFGRSLVSNNSPFDRYMRGDRDALTPAQLEGMERFERVGCTECHNGPMFSDYKVHVLGVPDNRTLPQTDRGMADMPSAFRTASFEGTPYAFRTASLRNLRYTAPYMHNGRFSTLGGVLEFYDDLPENPNVRRRDVDPLARRLDDPDDAADAIIAFLDALNDDSFDKSIPSRVPSGLNVGGRIQ
jgi:cytochrome c peroxidase